MTLFFFYGTLMAECGNPAMSWIQRHFVPVQPARTAGRLHVFTSADGCYPMIGPGQGVVRGRVYRIRGASGADLLAALDAYEEYSPRTPQASEYVRCRKLVRLSTGGRRLAWVYQGTARGLRGTFRDRPVLQPHGDFCRYLDETGALPFGARPFYPECGPKRFGPTVPLRTSA